MNALTSKLTERERLVITGWCDGLSNEEIAGIMRLSSRAVTSLGSRLLVKLEATCPRHATAIWVGNEIDRGWP